MRFVYPKFPKYDLLIFRLGGPGLGNLLFIYSRALVYARLNGYRMLYPTWTSLKIGPYLRSERDKRRYNNLFVNNSGYTDGLKKVLKYIFLKKICVSDADIAKDNQIIIFDEFIMGFDGLREYREWIYDDIIRNFNKKNKYESKAVMQSFIAVHVRLGDFRAASTEELLAGKNNVSIPIEWYKSIMEQINMIAGEKLHFYVFSDGTDEQLKSILELENVVRSKSENIVADILSMTGCRFLIASGSSTSMWARFLGQMSAITYKNQLKERNLCSDSGFEIEIADESFSEDDKKKILGVLHRR